MAKLASSVALAKSRASSLENVKNLNAWGSKIGDISVVRKMPNLEVASLSLNNITSLQDFAYCPKLRELYVRRNAIKDVDDICYLINLRQLRVLWLSDNPCSATADYRLTVIRNLESLRKLDNQEITEEERRLAGISGKQFLAPEWVPEYSGLDLSRTLRARDLIRYRNDPEERPCTPSTESLSDDEYLPGGHRDEHNHLAAMTPTDRDRQLDSQPELASSIGSSTVLPAVLLLLKQLDPSELKTVIKEAELLIDEPDGLDVPELS